MEKYIHALRSHNGGEFQSHAFSDLFSDVGICRQLKVPYNPQQNGVVERKNMTICEATISMMYDQDLFTSLWEEATSTVVYIQNKIPHVILKEKIPE